MASDNLRFIETTKKLPAYWNGSALECIYLRTL